MARVDACDPVAVITEAFIPDTHKPKVSKTRKRRTVHGPPVVKLFFETRREVDFFFTMWATYAERYSVRGSN